MGLVLHSPLHGKVTSLGTTAEDTFSPRTAQHYGKGPGARRGGLCLLGQYRGFKGLPKHLPTLDPSFLILVPLHPARATPELPDWSPGSLGKEPTRHCVFYHRRLKHSNNSLRPGFTAPFHRQGSQKWSEKPRSLFRVQVNVGIREAGLESLVCSPPPPHCCHWIKYHLFKPLFHTCPWHRYPLCLGVAGRPG